MALLVELLFDAFAVGFFIFVVPLVMSSVCVGVFLMCCVGFLLFLVVSITLSAILLPGKDRFNSLVQAVKVYWCMRIRILQTVFGVVNKSLLKLL